MAEDAKKNKKNLIIGICVAAVVIIMIVVVAVILATTSGIKDAYFVSDDTKYVITMETGNAESNESDGYSPIKVHTVYDYSGDAVTGVRMYYEYKDADAAKTAYNYIMSDGGGEDYKETYVDGKYIVFVSSEAQYEGLTTEDVKNQIEFIESLKNMKIGDTEGAEVENEETVEVVDGAGNVEGSVEVVEKTGE